MQQPGVCCNSQECVTTAGTGVCCLIQHLRAQVHVVAPSCAVLTGSVQPMHSTHRFGAAHAQYSRVRCSPSAVLTGSCSGTVQPIRSTHGYGTAHAQFSQVCLCFGALPRSPSLRSDRRPATSSCSFSSADAAYLRSRVPHRVPLHRAPLHRVPLHRVPLHRVPGVEYPSIVPRVEYPQITHSSVPPVEYPE